MNVAGKRVVRTVSPLTIPCPSTKLGITAETGGGMAVQIVGDKN